MAASGEEASILSITQTLYLWMVGQLVLFRLGRLVGQVQVDQTTVMYEASKHSDKSAAVLNLFSPSQLTIDN